MAHKDDGENANGPGLAAALAMAAPGDTAQTYLEEQTRLTRLQIEELKEDNALRRRIMRLEQASGAMKFAFELAAAFIFTAVALGLGIAVWQAANDNGLVVQSFSVPPDLANRGLTGEVVAAKLLDKLSVLQAATASNRAPSSYANNWGGDIKLQIPDTGVSIGEFNRSLHAWLGHQTRITGEVWRTPTGIAVTARAGSDTGPTLTGSEADLDKLIRQAAESVYRATQLYRYAVYLANAGRLKEAEAAYWSLMANGSAQDRAWALIGLANLYAGRGEVERGLAQLRRALALRPDFFMAYTNIAGEEGQLQHDEAALAAQRKSVELASRRTDPDIDPAGAHSNLLASQAALGADIGDYRAALRANHELEQLPDFNGQIENAHDNDITELAALHDAAAMREAIAQLPPTDNPQILLPRKATEFFGALLLGDPKPMIKQEGDIEAALAKLGQLGQEIMTRQLWPFLAYARALTGDFKSAHAFADKTPADCIQCLRMRGRIDALERNWAGAGYWFARATHDAPSPPFAWTDWGTMLLDKGDIDGAIAKFETAHQKSPNFADPLEGWGEALIKKNRSDLALAKFEEADKSAPNWGRLHLKWGEALWWSGHKDEARRQFAMAAQLDLTQAEKSQLARLAHG
ncbi:MAG: hypothetical protein JOZ13_09340 [Alphaproteobacteria bacterium]|nr:hypothetical protein [Alphaproteobacteria bacterium]